MKSGFLFNCLLTALLSIGVFAGQKANKAKAASEETADSLFTVKMIDLNATGDCTLLTYGKTQILIDCGGRNKTSTKNILEAVKASFADEKDRTLDYVIFSHGDIDHIYSFACKQAGGSAPASSSCLACYLREEKISIGTFIDFDPSKDPSLNDVIKPGIFSKDDGDETSSDEEDEAVSTSEVYQRYVNGRNKLLEEKLIQDYFTASQCLYEKRAGVALDSLGLRKENETEKPTCEFNFASNRGTIKILDNEYCYACLGERTNKVTALDKNILSVCCLVEFDDYKYLFTGDLPEFESSGSKKRIYGESKLIEKNYEDLKDGVLYFKAGHHGSMTSNSDNLLNVIKPQYVGISCVAAGQYHFPDDTVIENLGLYTDWIYITDCKIVTEDTNENGKRLPYHGTTTFTYSANFEIDEPLKVTFTGSLGKPTLTEDTLSSGNSGGSIWKLFDDKKQAEENTHNRRFSVRVIELSSWGLRIAPNDCTYIKMGHYDILVNDGVNAGDEPGLATKGKSDEFSIEEKIESLCNDHVLDCLVISSLSDDSSSRIVNLLNRIGQKSPIRMIKNVIINPFGTKNDMEKEKTKELVKKLVSLRSNGLIKGIVGINAKGALDESIEEQKIYLNATETNYVRILGSKLNSSCSEKNNENSLAINVHLSVAEEDFNYISFGSLNVLAEINDIVKSFDGTINAITIPFHGDLNVIKELSTSEFDYFWKKKKASNFAALFNGPFGAKNTEGENLYPINSFKHSSNLIKGSVYSFFTNKKIDGKAERMLDKDSLIDLAVFFRYPVCEKESVQARKFYSSSEYTYFSNYALTENKHSGYTKTQVFYDGSLKNLLK